MSASDNMTFVTRILIGALTCLLWPGMAGAAGTATLFRLFLNDGSTVVSYGEYARVDEVVIFSTPAGGTADEPRLHLVTLPAASVNWPRTEQYANSARYQQYAATRGDADFQQLSNEVAGVLNDVALTTDRARALAIAESARRTLAAWPQQHYGYRQDDVREILGLLDEAIAGLLPNGGPAGFSLSLVAVPPLPLEPVAGMPSPREQVDQLFRLAASADHVADRVALLQSAVALLTDAGNGIDVKDGQALRRSAEGQIKLEAEIDQRYTRLSLRLTAAASRASSRARVGDVEHILDSLPAEDARLGGTRPEAVQALRAAVATELTAARHLRLLRDQWLIRRDVYRDYQRSVASQLLQLVKAQPLLESIRHLDGPAPDRLVALRSRLSGGADRLQRLTPSADLQPLHGLVVGAWRFAESAVNGRYAAVSSGNVAEAWQASSAAAGALLMLSRAQQELRALLEPPQLK
jgi:hypothetical protein